VFRVAFAFPIIIGNEKLSDIAGLACVFILTLLTSKNSLCTGLAFSSIRKIKSGGTFTTFNIPIKGTFVAIVFTTQFTSILIKKISYINWANTSFTISLQIKISFTFSTQISSSTQLTSLNVYFAGYTLIYIFIET